jgi:uncharacterized iron-regulated protein
LLLLLPGCSQETDQTLNAADAAEPIQLITDGFYRSAEMSIAKLKDMSGNFANSITAFITQPDQTNLDSCRQAWLLLHNAFIELDFYFSKILRSNQFRALVFNIHTWPLEPGFIDSLPEYPTSGIVNDLTVELSKDSLSQQQAATSTEEIILGLHAVEYFLWQRSLHDYQPLLELSEQQVADGMVLEQLGNNRRRLALELISDILNEDLVTLQTLLTAEQRFDSNHVVNDPLNAIQRALKKSRNELMQVRSADQQNHSAFSQSSLQNILYKIYFIHESYSNDTNLNVVLQSRDHQVATEFQQTLETILPVSKTLQPNDSDGIARLTSLITLLDHHMEEILALPVNQTQVQAPD